MLSGAAGQLYGNHYTWTFESGWQHNLNTPGIRQLQYMKDFFSARQWWDLVPDQTHTVVIAGYGTFADSGSIHDNDYVTAARAPDGSLALAYCPTSTTITVDMTQMRGPTRASWFDPSSGTVRGDRSVWQQHRQCRLHDSGLQRRRGSRLGLGAGVPGLEAGLRSGASLHGAD